MVDLLPSSAEYSQLRAFAVVGERLSFSRAAELLGVSPSALSQMVRGLEERVGVRLLNRTTRSVALTEAGQILLARIQPAAAELGDAVSQARRYADRPSGTVRIHSFRSAARKYLEPLLGAFAEELPDVVLDITLDDETVDVVGEGYDLALRIGEVIERDMMAVRLGSELRQIAVASPAYIRRYGKPGHPRDLVDHRCVRWRWPGHQTPYAWEFFESAWFEVLVDGPLIVSDKEMAIAAARHGVGIAFVIEDVVQPLLASGELVALLDRWCLPFPGHFLCYPRQRQMAPALRAVIDMIRAGAAAPSF